MVRGAGRDPRPRNDRSRHAGLSHLQTHAGVSAEDVADILLSQAVTLRSKDDISVLVVEARAVV